MKWFTTTLTILLVLAAYGALYAAYNHDASFMDFLFPWGFSLVCLIASLLLAGWTIRRFLKDWEEKLAENFEAHVLDAARQEREKLSDLQVQVKAEKQQALRDYRKEVQRLQQGIRDDLMTTRTQHSLLVDHFNRWMEKQGHPPLNIPTDET